MSIFHGMYCIIWYHNYLKEALSKHWNRGVILKKFFEALNNIIENFYHWLHGKLFWQLSVTKVASKWQSFGEVSHPSCDFRKLINQMYWARKWSFSQVCVDQLWSGLVPDWLQSILMINPWFNAKCAGVKSLWQRSIEMCCLSVAMHFNEHLRTPTWCTVPNALALNLWHISIKILISVWYCSTSTPQSI